MRIGIVAYWFNRGQAVVARQIRSALDGLGHETFVLARPTRKTNIRPDWIDQTDVLGYINPTSNRFQPGWLALVSGGRMANSSGVVSDSFPSANGSESICSCVETY